VLADYTISHLAFEEALLEKVRYSHLKPHKGVHEMFVKRLEKYQLRQGFFTIRSRRRLVRNDRCLFLEFASLPL
jgi:hemerythrin